MKEIIKKFKFKSIAIIINAPFDLKKDFDELGFLNSFLDNQKSENTLVFVNNEEEYIYFLNNKLEKIVTDSVLWFAYPKGTSKIKTDINRDTIRVMGELFNVTTVTAISINETWSALRFRPIDKVGK